MRFSTNRGCSPSLRMMKTFGFARSAGASPPRSIGSAWPSRICRPSYRIVIFSGVSTKNVPLYCARAGLVSASEPVRTKSCGPGAYVPSEMVK